MCNLHSSASCGCRRQVAKNPPETGSLSGDGAGQVACRQTPWAAVDRRWQWFLATASFAFKHSSAWPTPSGCQCRPTEIRPHGFRYWATEYRCFHGLGIPDSRIDVYDIWGYQGIWWMIRNLFEGKNGRRTPPDSLCETSSSSHILQHATSSLHEAGICSDVLMMDWTDIFGVLNEVQ